MNVEGMNRETEDHMTKKAGQTTNKIGRDGMNAGFSPGLL
jgi:hypothetical protein